MGFDPWRIDHVRSEDDLPTRDEHNNNRKRGGSIGRNGSIMATHLIWDTRH